MRWGERSVGTPPCSCRVIGPPSGSTIFASSVQFAAGRDGSNLHGAHEPSAAALLGAGG